jgi:hypothetical protein
MITPTVDSFVPWIDLFVFFIFAGPKDVKTALPFQPTAEEDSRGSPFLLLLLECSPA